MNLSSAGAAVAPSMSSPVEQGFAPGSCVELGAVVGRGSRGSLPSDDKLTELALNDLAEPRGVAGRQRGATRARPKFAARDRSIRCSTRRRSCAAPLTGARNRGPGGIRERPSRGDPDRRGRGTGRAPPPDGAAGFLLHGRPKAEAACTQKGLAWNRDRSVASCSGAWSRWDCRPS